MLLPLSRAIVPDLDWRESSPSTNTELVAHAAALADFAVIATDTQTAGRGRLDRVWSAPSGTALAVSVLVRHDAGPGMLLPEPGAATSDAPLVDPRRLGWLPLVAGVAMCRAVQTLGLPRATLKWPNDVLVDDRKLSGILTELTPVGVVIGAGLNLTMTERDLPVPTATSLVVEGVPADEGLVDRALAAYLTELRMLVAQWRAAPDLADLRSLVAPHLHTLGRAVRVDRPGLPTMLGTAVQLDDDGRLIVQPTAQGSPLTAVAAGDVTHLRYE